MSIAQLDDYRTGAPRNTDSLALHPTDIDTMLWAFVEDRISAAEVPLCLLAWLEVGRSEMRDAVREARWEADRAWLMTYSAAERRDELLARLDAHADLVRTNGVEAALDVAFQEWEQALIAPRRDGGNS